MQRTIISFFSNLIPHTLTESAEDKLLKAITLQDLEALTALLASEEFSKQQLDKAAHTAAKKNFAAAIPLLFEKGADLFDQKNSMEGYTCLHIACHRGYSEVARAILATKPTDESLDITAYVALEDSSVNRCTAYELAETHGQIECIQLLEHTRQASYYHLMHAFIHADADEFKRVLAKDCPCDNIFIGPGYERYISLLGVIAIKHQENPQDALYDIALAYLANKPPVNQINMLVHALTYLREMRVDPSQSCYQALYALLISHKDNFAATQTLSLNGIKLEEKIWEVFKSILLEKKIQLIDFVSDYFISPTDSVNLSEKYILTFISLLLENRELMKCNLLVPPKFQPLANILKLILERNALIQKTSLLIKQDAIYNLFIPQINAQIVLLKYSHPDIADIFPELQPVHRPYSLLTTCAFFIGNKMTLKESDLPKLNEETKEIIALAKLNN